MHKRKRHQTLRSDRDRSLMSRGSLWFADDVAPVGLLHVDDGESWERLERSGREPWAIDQRILDPQLRAENPNNLLGMIPEFALAPFPDVDSLPGEFLRIGPQRAVSAREVLDMAEFIYITMNNSDSILGVAWHADGIMVFGTLCGGRLVSGVRPRVSDLALIEVPILSDR